MKGRLACTLLVVGALAQLAGSAIAGPAPKLKMSQGNHVLSYAPIYVARSLQLFRDEGLDMEVIVMESGTIALHALVAGSVEFDGGTSGDFLNAAVKGMELITVQAQMQMTQNLTARKAFVEKRGVNRSSPFAARVQAMKGATLGVSRMGAVSDIFLRYTLKKGGLDPDRDVNIVQIGGAGAIMAALQKGQIDGFFFSAPTGEWTEVQGHGLVLIPAGDIPGFDNAVYTILETRKSYAAQNPDIVARAARALGRANNITLDNPARAKEILQTYWAKVDPRVISLSLDILLPRVLRDGLMTEQGWQAAAQVLKDLGSLKGEVDTREGLYWTNKYLKGM